MTDMSAPPETHFTEDGQIADMPTVLFLRGWRFFFYMNERNEPPHIHVQKGEADAKYWLYPDRFDLSEAYVYRLTSADQRTVRQIIFEHFDYLVAEYAKFHQGPG